MEILQELFKSSGFGGETSLVWQNLVMFVIGGVLITLAVKKTTSLCCWFLSVSVPF